MRVETTSVGGSGGSGVVDLARTGQIGPSRTRYTGNDELP